MSSRVPILDPAAGSLDVERIAREFLAQGYAYVGRIGHPEAMRRLAARLDAMMLGWVRYDGLFFQLDTDTGAYDDLTYGRGFEGPCLRYRKVEKLEKDPLFLEWLRNDAFRAIAAAIIGPGPITLYRALAMTKPPRGGTVLPWHQDGGSFWGLTEQPILQFWTALDDAPERAGCVEVLSGTHELGLVTPEGGVVPDDKLARGEHASRAELVARRGDVFLIHNLVWHRSMVNKTAAPRRAMTACLMPARIRCTRKRRAPRSFFTVFDG